MRRAIERLTGALGRDPEAYIVASGKGRPTSTRAAGTRASSSSGRHEYGARQTRSFVHRLRSELLPRRASRPARASNRRCAGAGRRLPRTAYGAFPWLALAVCVATYLVLLRAFRSLLLPLTAVC